jgi:hypothetical protein
MSERAQVRLFGHEGDGSVYFNCDEIVKQASLLLPTMSPEDQGAHNILSPQFRTLDDRFKIIQMCRYLIAAYHMGRSWSEVGIDGVPRVPMIHPDDMTLPCRFETHLDSNGNG